MRSREVRGRKRRKVEEEGDRGGGDVEKDRRKEDEERGRSKGEKRKREKEGRRKGEEEGERRY